MAKYQKYAEYKDSGVEWLGNVPQHWALVPCRAVVDHIVEKNSNNAFDNYLSLMANIGVIKYEDKGDVGNKKPDDLSKCKIVRKGQLVINSMNYAIGSYGMSPYDGICSPVYIVLQAKKDTFLERFALRVFENTPFQKYLATFGNGILEHRAAINWEDIKNKYVPLPTLNEQKNILDFLDHETTKIDNLIKKQQQLIELLKEKRQAVISHAVTKGLDPNVPMKDSGVEWLGEVPEHWRVSSIGYYAKVTNGTTPSKANLSYWDKQEIPWLSSGEVNQYYIVEASEYITKKALEECSLELLPIGTVVMGMIGQGKTRGLSAITRLEATINQNLAALEAYPKLNNEYLHYYLQSTYDYIREEGRGGNQAALNCEIIRKFPITLPPFEEQVKIIKQIKNLSVTFKALIRKAESAIQLMQERRTALISAAVTGKIDVRNWQAPTVTEAQTELSA